MCIPFRLAHPLAHQVRTAHAEKGAVRLGRDGLGQKRLSRPGRAVEEDALPRLPLADEEMGELDREDDGLLQRLLGALQARHILPLDVRLILQDGARERIAQLLVLGVAVALVLLALAAAALGRAVRTQHPRLLVLALAVGQVLLQLLRALHVLRGLGADHLLGLGVLLPFQREHEQLEGLVVELVRLVVVACGVGFDGLLDHVDGPAEEVGVRHDRGMCI